MISEEMGLQTKEGILRAAFSGYSRSFETKYLRAKSVTNFILLLVN